MTIYFTVSFPASAGIEIGPFGIAHHLYAIQGSGSVSAGPEPTIFPGDHGEEETPVPIPNTAVKLLSGDGTMALAMGE